MEKKELIEKYGECVGSPDQLHWFNYVMGKDLRACMQCGVKVNTKTQELV